MGWWWDVLVWFGNVCSANQMWLARKSLVNRGLKGNIVCKWSVFRRNVWCLEGIPLKELYCYETWLLDIFTSTWTSTTRYRNGDVSFFKWLTFYVADIVLSMASMDLAMVCVTLAMEGHCRCVCMWLAIPKHRWDCQTQKKMHSKLLAWFVPQLTSGYVRGF